MLDEGIRAAAEIGQVQAEGAGPGLDPACRPQDLGAQTPVHRGEIREIHPGDVDEVHGQGGHPDLGQALPEPEVQAFVVEVVGAARHDHDGRMGIEAAEDFIPFPVQHLLELCLLFERMLKRPPDVGLSQSQPIADLAMDVQGQHVGVRLEIEGRTQYGLLRHPQGGPDHVRIALHHGAIVAPLCGLRCGHVDGDGEEHEACFSHQQPGVAVGDLHRVARLGRHALDAPLGNLFVGGRCQHQPEPEVIEKVRPQQAGLNPVEGALHPHRGPAVHFHHRCIRQRFIDACHVALPDLLPQGKKVFTPLAVAACDFVAAALPAPDACVAVEAVDLEFAPVMAAGIGLADLFCARHLVRDGAVEPPEGARRRCGRAHPLLQAHRGTVRAQHFPVPGHQEAAAEHIFEGGDDTLVERGAAQEHHPSADLAFSDHPVQVVVDNGVAEPGDEILPRDAFLVVGHEIRLHEHGAAFGQFHRCCGGESDLLEFAHDVDPVLVGQFMQKAARPGGADLVHVEVERVGIGDGNVFRVLTADLDDRVHGRVDFNGAACVSRDLVDDEIGPQEIPHHAPPGPGGGHPGDLNTPAHLLPQVLQERLSDLDGLPLGGDIVFVQNFSIGIDKCILGGRGADVDA